VHAYLEQYANCILMSMTNVDINIRTQI
jgi:hypothetical protein